MNTNRSGGKSTERSVTNDIMFDHDAAWWLWDWLFKQGLVQTKCTGVLDACCGTGILGCWWIPKSEIVDFVDVKMNGFHRCYQTDILKWEPGSKYDVIICNPPWSPVHQAEGIYHHLLSLLKPKGCLYFIINYAFLNTGWKRGAKLGRGIQIPLPRYTFHKSLKEHNPESTGLLDPVLMINRQRVDDPPFFCPIPPEICKSDQKILF